ncbi:hypothetical protein U1Q18_018596 [Sarracenia purpurea var. burkii]
MEDERDTAYLRQRRMKSSMSLSCCFSGHNRRFDSYDSSLSSPDLGKLSPILSPSSWFRPKGQDQQHQENKSKYRSLMPRMGRRRHSADFSYDPLSYALNFDEGSSDDDFSSRLPVSPPRRRPSTSRIRDLELPVPWEAAGRNMRNSKSAAAPPMKDREMRSAAAATAGRRSVDSPTGAAGRRSVESPTGATGGIGTVERPSLVSLEIPVE